MKTLVKVQEVEGEGLLALMGKTITVMCANFFYTGKLVGVNDTCIKLADPSIVYETGDWNNAKWANASKLPTDYLYVQTGFIESFAVLKQS